jgi:hypothetical protein
MRPVVPEHHTRHADKLNAGTPQSMVDAVGTSDGVGVTPEESKPVLVAAGTFRMRSSEFD